MDKLVLTGYIDYIGKTIYEYIESFHISKNYIKELFINNNILINGEQVNNKYILKSNDKIEIIIKEKINYVPYKMEIEILYEDDNILIVNKPSGLLIHPDKEQNIYTLSNAVANYYYQHKIFREVRYVHRIDFDTSGIVIFAKNILTAAYLNYEISNHNLLREYLAICQNKFSKKEGIVDKPIGRDRHVSNKYRVGFSKESKEAITNYKVIKTMNNNSLVLCKLNTGRTHQIRVHMSYLNHPLAGDELYGGKIDEIQRVALHSYHTRFVEPISGKIIEVFCHLPNDMNSIIKYNKE